MMKIRIILLANLLLLLPLAGQVQAQGGPAAKAPVKTAAASAPIGFSREKTTDICTTAPRSDWLPEDEMKLLAEHRGYRIKTFKLAKGDCYEIYGFDREGRIVEAYFNPVTSRLVRQNIAH